MHIRMIVCRLMLVSSIALGTAVHAEDIVVLTNGSRMIGTIRQLARGELTFSITGAERVDIDWNNVQSLQSTRRLDIALISGERFTASIASMLPGRLEVVTDAGPRIIDLKDMGQIHPIEATFLERISGDVELGLEFLTANDERDWTFNAALASRTQNYLTEISLSSLARRFNSQTVQQRNDLEFGSRRFLDNRWFAIGLLEAEEDRELDLDLRLLAGAAIGRTIVQSSRHALSLYGGLDIVHEEYAGVADADDDLVEALVAVEWHWFDIGELEFAIEATTYVAPDDGRVRFDLESSLRREISGNYYLSFNVYENYNSDPPQGSEESDLGLSLTFGRSF